MPLEHDDADDDPRLPLLRQVSREMVARQKQYWGKGPKHVKSYIVDDMLFIVMRGGVTVAERTMVGFGQEDLVRQLRQTFENETATELSQMVERLTQRKVLNYQSQIMFDPDVVVEIFVFDHDPEGAERFAVSELNFDDD
jgi:uncharacterized protein YbcI